MIRIMPSNYTSKACKIGEDFAPGPILSVVEDLDQDGVFYETVLRVASARVAYVNYGLLQHDFPQLQEAALEKAYPPIKALSGAEKQKAICQKIDDWLLRNTAFVSESQARQSIVNTPIAIGKEQVRAYRPPGYGRALVFSVEETEKGLFKDDGLAKTPFENRLIDVKGTGVGPNLTPVHGSHSNGVYQLGYAFVELVVQELLQRIFRHQQTAFQTLPIYGIIDLGFEEQTESEGNFPAGLLVRRAHRRPKDSGGLYAYGTDGQHIQLRIEQVLRKYGITSVNNVTTIKIWKENGRLQIQYGDQRIDFFNEAQIADIEKVSHYEDGSGELHFEGINIQHTREIGMAPTQATLVDFQTYAVKEHFENPLLSLVSDKLLRWGGSIWPEYDNFVRPDPRLKIPFHLYSAPGNIWGYDMGAGKKKINSLCFGLAEDFKANKISRDKLLHTLQLYLDALTAHWTE